MSNGCSTQTHTNTASLHRCYWHKRHHVWVLMRRCYILQAVQATTDEATIQKEHASLLSVIDSAIWLHWMMQVCLASVGFGNAVMDWFAKCFANDAQDGNDLISYDEMKASMLHGNAPFIPKRKWLTVSEFHRLDLNPDAMHNLSETWFILWATLFHNHRHVTRCSSLILATGQPGPPCSPHVVPDLPHCSARASSIGTCFCRCMAQMVLLWGKLRGLQFEMVGNGFLGMW